MQYIKRHSGFTLIELLVVLAIIVLITSVSIPLMMRGGIFSSNTTAAAAADLFAQLRGAQTYATTKNVDTAIVYGIALDPDGSVMQDSLFEGNPGAITPIPELNGNYIAKYSTGAGTLTDNFIEVATFDPEIAVMNSTLIARRVTLEELSTEDSNGDTLAALLILNNNDIDDLDDATEVFVTLGDAKGTFQDFPNDTCLLTNHPVIDDTRDSFLEETGLVGIKLVRIELDGTWLVDRILPRIPDPDTTDGIAVFQGLPEMGTADLNLEWGNQFPAHVFSKKGGLIVDSVGKQRIRLSVGVLPNQPYFDRFLVDGDGGMPDRDSEIVSLDTDIDIYVPTGRVKVVSDVQ